MKLFFYTKRHLWSLIIVFFQVLVMGQFVLGQNARDFEFSQSVGTYTPITGGTVVFTGVVDNQILKVPIENSFTFLGLVQDSLTISTNGHISFPTVNNLNSVAIGTYGIISSSLSNSGGAIAGFAADLQGHTDGEVRYQSVADEVVIQWSNYRRYNQISDTLNFQIRLNTSTGVVKIVYGRMKNAGTSLIYQPEVGLRGRNNNDFNNRQVAASTGFWINSIEGGMNNTKCYFSGVMPGTIPEVGTNFQFTPNSCAVVNAGQVSSITINSVTVSWLSPIVTPANGYEYYYSSSNVVPSAEFSGTPVTATTVNIPGLSSNTSYYVWVRSVCSNTENSRWYLIARFHTLCESTPIPYYENFDSSIIPGIPPCTNIEQAGNGNMWETTTIYGSTVLFYSYHDIYPANSWFYTRGLELVSGQSYRLKYSYGAASDVYPEVLNVAIGTMNQYASMNTIIATHDPVSNIGLGQAYVDFFVPSDGVYYIGFQAASDYDQFELYLDNIAVELTPTCFEPLTITEVSISNTSVTLAWEGGTILPSNGYEYYFSAVDSAPNNTVNGTVITDTFVTIPSLNPNTNYYFWVRAICSVTDRSVWSAMFPTTTYCNPLTVLPWSEDFENVVGVSGNYNQGLMPNCWEGVDQVGVMDNTGTYIESETGVNALVFRYGANTNTGSWAITPGLVLEEGTLYRFSFSYRNYNTNPFDSLTIKLGNSQNINSFTTTLGIPLVNITNTEFERYYVDFEVPLDGVYFIGMNVKVSSAPWYLSVDNVNLDISPTCIPPIGLNATLVTNASATISWEQSLSSFNTYEYYISTDSASPTADSTGIIVNTNSTNLVSLDANTTYHVWVRSNCTGENSDWSFPYNFTTECDAITAIPWLEDFEGNSNVNSAFVRGRMPDCWLGLDEVGVVNNSNAYISAHDGTSALAFRYGTNPANGAWAITPGVSLLADSSYRFKFFYKNYNAVPFQSLTVHIGQNQSGESLITQLGSGLYNITATDYHEYHVDFTVTTDGIYYLGINVFANNSPWYLMVDDVSIDFSPDCIDPENLQISALTSNSANVVWNASATSANIGYEYYLAESSVEPGESAQGIDVTTNAAMITDLNENSTYYLWVRTKCSENSNSPWSDFITFSTPCEAEMAPTTVQDFTSFLPLCWATAMSDENDPFVINSIESFWEEDGFSGVGSTGAAMINLYGQDFNWLISNPIDLGATAGVFRLKYNYAVVNFYSGLAASDYGNHEVDVIVSTDGGLSWQSQNVIYTHSGSQVLGQNLRMIDLSDYSGIVRVAFRAKSDGISPDLKFSIDNFIVEEIPSCLEPFGVAVNSITSNSAVLEWSVPSSLPAFGYQYYFATTSSNPTNATLGNSVPTGTNVLINNLEENTTYYVWVRSVCSSTDTSTWMGGGSFITSCNPTNVPYYQDFASSIIPSIPSCTSMEVGNQSNSWFVEDYEGSNVLIYEYNDEFNADTWFFTQGINLTAGVAYRITYDFSAMGYMESMKIAYGTVANSTGMTNVLVDYPAFNFDEFHEDHVDFTPTTSGVYYFGFHAYSNADQYLILLDNIIVDYAPCGSAVSISGGGTVCNGEILSEVSIALPLNGEWTISYSTGSTTETFTETINNNIYSFTPTIPGTYTLVSAIGSCSTPVLTGEVIVAEREPITFVNQQTICSDQTYIIGNSEYETTGNYYDVFTSVLTGCDSTVNTVLTVLPPLSSTENVTICEGHVWNVGSNSYYSSGTYTTILESMNGCDSSVITNLTLVTIVPIVSHNNEVFYIEPVLHATYQWINCETDSVMATTANFVATENGSYRLRITVDQCSEATTCYPVQGLSVQSIDVFKVDVYPNPTKDIANIVTKGSRIDRIEVLDVNGRIVINQLPNTDNQVQVNLESLDEGVYLINIYSENNSIVRRVTKQ